MPVKMHDAGEKSNYGCCPSPVDKPTVYYPTLRLDDKQAPFLNGVVPKKKVKLLVEAEVTGIEIRMQTKKSTDYTLKIKKIGIIGKPMGAKTRVEEIADGGKLY